MYKSDISQSIKYILDKYAIIRVISLSLSSNKN